MEFPNEEQAAQFKKPDWLGEEIGYKEFSNLRLSCMKKEEFRNKVSEEVLNHNKKIIEKLSILIKLDISNK